MSTTDTELDVIPTVTTDLLDYQPGETATITTSGFVIGSTLEFQVLHVTDPGEDGVYGTLDDILDPGPDGISGTADDGYGTTGAGHDPWYVTDGVWWVIDAGADGIVGTADDIIGGDLDKTANGSITTTWYVNPDDSAGETFLLTATGDGGTPTDTSDDQVATTSFTDAVMLDLTSAESSGTLNGAFFSTAEFKGATGLFNPFLQIQHNGYEDGYNTQAGNEYDTVASDPLMLDSIPVAIIDGEGYYEFRLDLNQTNGGALISLDTLKIFQAASDDLTGSGHLSGFTLDNGTPSTSDDGILVYDMGADNWVGLNYALAGSGGADGDVSVFVPTSLFDAANGDYVYLYSKFGYQGGVWQSDDGRESWGIGPGTPIGASDIAGYKFSDVNHNGVWDNGEAPLAGVTVYLDSQDSGTPGQLDWTDGNGNNLWDPGEGEQWTVTDSNGAYVFANLAAGLGADSTYHVREEVPTGYTQTAPGDGTYDINGDLTANAADITSTVSNFEITVDLKDAGLTYNLPDFGNWLTTPVAGTVTGYKWEDSNNDGAWNNGETGLQGWKIYFDSSDTGNVGQLDWTDGNGNGAWDPGEGEQWAFTDSNGNYTLSTEFLTVGESYAIREVSQPGWVNTYDGNVTFDVDPNTGEIVNVSPSETPAVISLQGNGEGNIDTAEPLNFGNFHPNPSLSITKTNDSPDGPDGDGTWTDADGSGDVSVGDTVTFERSTLPVLSTT